MRAGHQCLMKTDPLLDTYFEEICQTPLLSPMEEVELAKLVQRGDASARDRMIRANLRLVVKIALRYQGCGLALGDLVAEGNTGLMKAVERFEPDRGAKFSTYAAWWIRQAIRRALSNQSRTVRLPVHMVERISKLRKASHEIEEKTGRRASLRELEEATGLDRKLVNLACESGQAPTSLDAPAFDDDGCSMHEHLNDETVSNPHEQLSDANMMAQLGALLEVLDNRERKIIEARFGLGGRKPQTLERVGKTHHVSRERIRQIQTEALAKMRDELRRRETPMPKVMRLIMRNPAS